jgi:BMFP domain-containing protein YqiC
MQLPCQDALGLKSTTYTRYKRLRAPTWRGCDFRLRYESATLMFLEQRGRSLMSFINASALDDLARRLAESVPESVRAFGRDLEGNFKAVLQSQLSKLDLVNRTEFDVQAELLARTQAQLAAMEARLKDLEAKLAPQ